MVRRIVWAEKARRDYHAQLTYIAEQNAANAELVDGRIMDTIGQLAERPIGRPGRVMGTYEKRVLKTSLIVAYLVEPNELQIVRIVHTKQNWPRDEWPEEN